MAGRTLAGSIGLTGDWDLGENNWKDANDLNLLKLSVLTQGRALELVSATPGAPAEGDIYLFSDTHPTQAGKIAIYDEAAWLYLTPGEGWRMWDVDSDFMREFDGTTWIEVTGGGGGGALEVEDEGVVIDAAVTKINFTGNVVVTQTAAGEIEVEVTGGGGGGGSAVGSHRYWKVHDMATSALSNAVAAAEMRLRSTPGGSNLAVTSSYCVEENASYPSTNLYNGNLSDLWGVNSAAATAVCSIIFDMGSAVAVEEIMIVARNDSFFYQAPRSFTLSWSDDGQVFREVANFEVGTYTGAGAQKLAAVPTTYP